MERETSDREALRRKAEEARAALKQDCQEDDYPYVTTGRPKFAPPVKSHGYNMFGEKLQNSLGAFEVVGPLLQTLKNRPIYGVSPCPQTPAPISSEKAPFSALCGPQPSTSASTVPGESHSSKNGSGASPGRTVAARKERSGGSRGSSGSGQSRSPRPVDEERDRNKKHVSGERDHRHSSHRFVDKNGRSSRNDRHGDEYHRHHHSSHPRRPVNDPSSHEPGASSSGRGDQPRPVNHAPLRRSGSGDCDRERKRAGESKDARGTQRSPSSLSTVSADSSDASRRRDWSRSNPEKPRQQKVNDDEGKVGNRQGKERNEQRSSGRLHEPSTSRASSPTVNKPGSTAESVKKTYTKTSQSPSESNRQAEATTMERKTDSTGGADKSVQKRDTGSSQSGKKHPQPSLRLERPLVLPVNNNARHSEDDALTTPSIEKMIKRVTDIVDAPPLSGIPPADDTAPPFSYPIKANESDKQATKSSKNYHQPSAGDATQRNLSQKETDSTGKQDLPVICTPGKKKRTTIEADLSMSESDDEDEKSDIGPSRNGKISPIQEEPHVLHDLPLQETARATNEDTWTDRGTSDKSPLNRPESTGSPGKADSKSHTQPKYTWSISSLLGNVSGANPAANAETRNSGKGARGQKTGDSRRERADKNSDLFGETESDTAPERASAAGIVEHGEASSSNKETPGKIGGKLKMSLKIKHGKIQVVDREKGADGAERQSGADVLRKKKRPGESSKRDLSPLKPAVVEDPDSKKMRRSAVADSDSRRGTAADKDRRKEKENMQADAQMEGTAGQSKQETPSVPVNGFNASAYETDAETILQESRLSPLLSPIHEFPPLEFVNGRPTLLCQIPLNMLERVPPPKNRQSQEKCNGGSSMLAEPSQNGSPDENTLAELTSPAGKRTAEQKKVTTATADANDLDDVPILDRIVNSDQKKRLSTSGAPSASHADEEPTPVKPEKNSVTKQKMKVQEAKNNSGEQTISKKEGNSKSNKSATKRKGNADCAPDGSPPSKAAKLESSANALTVDAPTKPVTLDLDLAKEQQYQAKAKDLKHSADSQMDRTKRIMLYLEAVTYFIMTGLCMEEKALSKQYKESSAAHTLIKTTADLLKSVAQKFVCQMTSGSSTSLTGFVTKIDILSLRIQSLCHYKMFEMRQTQAISNYRQLNEFHRTSDRISGSAPSSVSQQSGTQASSNSTVRGQHNISSDANGTATGDSRSGVTPSPTPSPASSTGSSHSLPPGLVAIPQQIEALYKQQLSHLHSLMWAHYHWQQGEQRLQSQDDKAFFDHLNKLCGPLTLTSNLFDLCTYVFTAVSWLRQSYGRLRP